ncbi:MAG: hypothetical protein ACE5QF_08770 [Thermoplasmata archaeon]
MDDALKITRKNVADELDGLPPQPRCIAPTCAEALHEAARDLKRKRGVLADEGKSPGNACKHNHNHCDSC